MYNDADNINKKSKETGFTSKTMSISLLKQYTEASTITKLENYLNTGICDENLTSELTKSMLNWAIEKNVTHFIPFLADFFMNFLSKSNGFIPIKIKQRHFENLLELQKFKIFVDLKKGYPIFSNVKTSNSTYLCEGIKDLRSAPFIIRKILYVPIILDKKIEEFTDFYTPIINVENIFTNSVKNFLERIKTNAKNLHIKYSWTQDVCIIPERVFLSIKNLSSFEEIKQVISIETFDFEFFMQFLNVLKVELYYLGLEIRELNTNEETFIRRFIVNPQSIIVGCISQLKFNELIKVVAKEFGLVVFHGNCPLFVNRNLEKKYFLSILTNENILSFNEEPMTKLRVLILIVCAICVISEKNDFLQLFLGEVNNNPDFIKNSTTFSNFKIFLGEEITNILEIILQIKNIGLKVKNGLEYLKIIEEMTLTGLCKKFEKLDSAFIYSDGKFIFKINQFIKNPCIFITTFLWALNEELSNFTKLYDEKINQDKFTEVAAIFDVLKGLLEKCSKPLFEGNIYYSSNLNSNEIINQETSNILNCIVSIKDNNTIKICSDQINIHPNAFYNWYKFEIESFIYNLRKDFTNLKTFAKRYLENSLLKFKEEDSISDSPKGKSTWDVKTLLYERSKNILNLLSFPENEYLTFKNTSNSLVKAMILLKSLILVKEVLRELKVFELMISGKEYSIKEMYECIKMLKYMC